MNSVWQNFDVAIGVVAGAALAYFLLRKSSKQARAAQAREVEALRQNAQREAEVITQNARLAASEEALKLRTQVEQSVATRQVECLERERQLAEREKLLGAQLNRVLETEQGLKLEKETLGRRGTAMEGAQAELIKLTQQRRQELENLAKISPEEARRKFLKEIEAEAMRDASKISRLVIDEAKAKAEEKARNIIAVAIQRYAGDHTLEGTTATITLDNAEIKGRIIGREGRNIRAFENATGVTVLIDDTPGAVLLSGFDPVRREIAREAMQLLILDGRIHPSRIEEVVAKVTQDMDQTVLRHGEEAIVRAGLPPLHHEIAKTLGKLHFRRSFSQNLLEHSVEVAQLMGLMAAELGVDVNAAKRAGLLHDIGKALSHEVEGPHAIVGADLIKRCGESDEVVNGVASHHNDVPPVGPLGILVSAADAISASRPGARSESMTTYLKRVEDLEKIGNSFPGVEKSFAVQAGRELRVFVQPEAINDDQAFALARSVAAKIEEELQYPGQIRITVIRETRCVEVAK
jgi:ribonuclease Y